MGIGVKGLFLSVLKSISLREIQTFSRKPNKLLEESQEKAVPRSDAVCVERPRPKFS